jgi:hypothetical protein
MFFYSEQTNLVISASVTSVSFAEVRLGQSSSVNFTLYGIDGKQSETVTLADSSNEFDISPTIFTLSNFQNQTINVKFVPLTTGSKSTSLNISTENGNVIYIPLNGIGVWSSISASGGVTGTINI